MGFLVIALVRWVSKFFKTEFRFLNRYERAHPHFFWFISLDAVVSVVLATLVFQVFVGDSSSNPFENLLDKSGRVGMAADKLIDRLRGDKEAVYWLGPISGMTYSIEHSLDYVDVVTYLPKGADIQDSTQARLTVETFETSQGYSHHVHVLTNGPTEKVVTSKGYSVEYDGDSLKSMTIIVNGSSQPVIVSYPSKQSESALLQDAAKLSLVH